MVGHTFLPEWCHSFSNQGPSFSFKVQSLDVSFDRMASQARDDACCALCSLVYSLASGVVHGLTAFGTLHGISYICNQYNSKDYKEHYDHDVNFSECCRYPMQQWLYS